MGEGRVPGVMVPGRAATRGGPGTVTRPHEVPLRPGAPGDGPRAQNLPEVTPMPLFRRLIDDFKSERMAWESLAKPRGVPAHEEHPVVRVVETAYPQGVRLKPKAMKALESEVVRLDGPGKWFEEIPAKLRHCERTPRATPRPAAPGPRPALLNVRGHHRPDHRAAHASVGSFMTAQRPWASSSGLPEGGRAPPEARVTARPGRRVIPPAGPVMPGGIAVAPGQTVTLNLCDAVPPW
jgi:hypothetical protein